MTFTARELLARLVSFPTVSRESNLELIDFVETYLDDLGVRAVRVPNAEGNKASLYAHVGPNEPGGVVLSGHTDVVPIDGQDWSTDPFQVVEKEGKLFGRGTCDMKGFDALALSAVPLALGRGLKRPLQIALSYDEEVGCVGAPPMIDHMLAHGMPAADTVLVGEPSMMKVVTGHKGGFGFHIHFQGFEVHSSIAYQGVSAIMMAAKLIDWANGINAQSAAQTPSPVNAAFDPPYSSLHFGTIKGGTANNITAKDCYVTMDVRLVPGDDKSMWQDRILGKLHEIEAEMQSIQPSCRVTATPFFGIPGLKPEADGRAEALARGLTGDNGTHVVSYGTEAGQFQERGYSAVVCGPGDIAQAHQPNEYITVDQFQQGEAFMSRLVEHLASDPL